MKHNIEMTFRFFLLSLRLNCAVFLIIPAKKMDAHIQRCTTDHLQRYADIYAEAFSGEPWNDTWTVEDAFVHVSDILESKQSYGLEYMVDGRVAGFILGTSMLFHYGRTFEINDLAVAIEYQGQGIATRLLERCISDLKDQGMKAVHLITASEGVLPRFYQKFGFNKEHRVMLMGMDLQP